MKERKRGMMRGSGCEEEFGDGLYRLVLFWKVGFLVCWLRGSVECVCLFLKFECGGSFE